MVNNKKAFARINNRLDYYSSGKFSSDLILQLVVLGRAIAEKNYEADGEFFVDVNWETNGKNKGRVYAESSEILFIEYGTGREGEAKPHPEYKKLHNVPITGTWEYYYPSKFKVKFAGLEGWLFGGEFTTGRNAGCQMYRTAKVIRKKIAYLTEWLNIKRNIV